MIIFIVLYITDCLHIQLHYIFLSKWLPNTLPEPHTLALFLRPICGIPSQRIYRKYCPLLLFQIAQCRLSQLISIHHGHIDIIEPYVNVNMMLYQFQGNLSTHGSQHNAVGVL